MSAGQWYYGRGSDISGPVSGKELTDLANAGNLVSSDTVWQEGTEMGVPAGRVRNLFANANALPVAAIAPAPERARVGAKEDSYATDLLEAPAPAPVVDPNRLEMPAENNELVPIDPNPEEAEAAPPPKPFVRKARAVAGKGVVIVGQDGINVKFKMKCTKCGHEDSSWKTAAITRGSVRRTYFCPKCKKKCDGEVNFVQ